MKEYSMEKRKIDLVYLWCDGNDPEFMKRRTAAFKELGRTYNIDATSDGRVFQIDELKYSLRSVEKYMPWINHIYIVTDHQVPEWLNLDNPKISIVEQSLLLPKTVKYCFNSNAIESVLYKIPNLSECFIYANDDMFVNRPVSPDFFFDKLGRCIVRGNFREINPKKSLYNEQLLYVHKKIKEKFSLDLPINPHHNFDPYLKSDCEACVKCFKKEFEAATHHVFRQFDSMQRLIFHLYSIAHNRGTFKNLEDRKWYQNMSSMYIANNAPNRFEQFKKQKPILFCINDTSYSQQKHRIHTFNFLNALYPSPSSFEKADEYTIEKQQTISIWKFRDTKQINNQWVMRKTEFSIFGISLYSLYRESKSERFYLFGILPLYKIVIKPNKKIFKLFNFIPLLKFNR